MKSDAGVIAARRQDSAGNARQGAAVEKRKPTSGTRNTQVSHEARHEDGMTEADGGGLGRHREASMIASSKRYLTAFAATAVLALGLYGCGGGGGDRAIVDPDPTPDPMPTAVSLADVTAGFMALAGMFTVTAGQSAVHGDIEFSCAAGGSDCTVIVAVDTNGDITATSIGGMVAAMNSAAYTARITPVAVDLAPVTAGFMAGAGNVTITAGQSAVHGDIAFSCAAGGADCAVEVEVDANGDITATSTGGMVTAMNSDAYTARITPMAVDLSPVTAGFMAGAGTVQVAAGQSAVHGDIEFSCAAGGSDCTVTVAVGTDGAVSATSTGGMVAAMNSTAYTARITPVAVDLAPVTAGFMAGAGNVTITAGQSAVHGDIAFSCAAGGADCAVEVEVDANGDITATSTGGMVTAMNSDAYTARITPMAVDLSPVTAGFMAGAGTVQVAAGQSAVHGDIEFSCAAGGSDCTVTVAVGTDGAVSATSTGGMVAAMNSADYQNAVTPMNVDLAGVTSGFMADAGTVTIEAGQSEEHDDISFTCAAGGRDCEVMVMVDANGDITATSTGGMVAAMNSTAYTARITPVAVDLAPVTAGFMAGAGNVTITAGQSAVHGDIAFSCAAGGADCAVEVEVDANGDITATSTGGMVTAMNSDAYTARITPMAVDLSPVTAGFMAGAGTVQVAAGQSAVHGDIEFSCAAGGSDCTVTVAVGTDGAVSATSTGGMVAAMNSADYQNAVTPMNVDLAGVTSGFMADAGTVTIEAGQSEEHDDISFTCAAGGRDCEVMVMVDANGDITATSTGGMVTAMNAHGHPHLHGLEASPLASPTALSAADSMESLNDAGTTFAPVSAPVKITSDAMGQAGVVVLERDEEAYVESITYDGAGGYGVVLVVDGTKSQVEFEAADWILSYGEFAYYEKTIDGTTYIFARVPIFAEFKAVHRRYFQLFYWETEELRGIAALGATTPSQALVNLGSATYEGHIIADRHNNFTDPDFMAVREAIWGFLTLNADFSGSTIAGSAIPMWMQLSDGTWVPIPDTNSIVISDGEIDGSRFDASWRGEDTDAGAALEDSFRGFEGSMLGEFYGPDGEEIGGVFTGGRAATDQVIHGRFGGESQQAAAARMAVQTAAGRDDGISVSQDPAVYATGSSDTLSNLLPDGNTAFAPLSAAVRRDRDYGETRLPDEGGAFVKSVASDGANGFNVTYVIDGRDSVVNLPADSWYEPWGAFRGNKRGENNNHWFNQYSLWSMTDSMNRDPDDRTSGSSKYYYFDMVGWNVDRWRDSFEGYSTFGVQTNPSDLPTGSATYYGDMSARVWAGDDPYYPSGRSALFGSLELNADFDSSSISGQIDEFYVQVGEFTNPFQPMREGNSFDISNGVIVDGQFSADWVGVDTNASFANEYTVTGLSGTMAGEFYGPGAEEVGGVIGGRGSALASVPDHNLAGVFGAIREDVARPTGQ